MRARLGHFGESIMTADLFTERLAQVRRRFVTTLEGKIADTFAELPRLSGNGSDVADRVEQSYRRIHGIVGIGPTVGFAATGKAAKTVENLLLVPHRAARGLVAQELDAVTQALEALQAAARQELQSTTTNGF
jgi:HPt (histidine-containing phosphotransfer) domain-containing protein